jgi:hypothetical protein
MEPRERRWTVRAEIRLLITGVRGVGERIADVVRAARGRLERDSFKLLARDTALQVIVVSCKSEEGAHDILRSLQQLEGVSVLGIEGVDRRERE